MTTFLLIGGGVLTAIVVVGMLLLRLARLADQAAEANARAEKAEVDARNQEEYARIGAQRHTADDTAGVLDKGKF